MKRRKRRKKSKNRYKKNFFERNKRKKRKRTLSNALPTERSISPPKKKVRMGSSNQRTPTMAQHATPQFSTQSNQSTGGSVVYLQRDDPSKHCFYFFEQLLVKHNLQSQLRFVIMETKRCLKIEFASHGHAQRMVQFIRHFLPCKMMQSPNPSICNLSLLPFQPFDLVLLSPGQFQKSGKKCGPFLVCYEYGRIVRFVDPQTLRTCEVDGKSGLNIRKLCSFHEAEEYTVLNIRFTGLRTENDVFVQGEVEVQKTKDLGIGASKIVPCHFGHYLEVGDVIWGYDLAKMNWGDRVDRFRGNNNEGNCGLDIILTRKKFRHRVVRHWKLMNLSTEISKMERGNDYDDFENMVAENENWRKNINLFKNEQYDFSNWGKEEKQKGLNIVQLTELMNDLEIDED